MRWPARGSRARVPPSRACFASAAALIGLCRAGCRTFRSLRHSPWGHLDRRARARPAPHQTPKNRPTIPIRSPRSTRGDPLAQLDAIHHAVAGQQHRLVPALVDALDQSTELGRTPMQGARCKSDSSARRKPRSSAGHWRRVRLRSDAPAMLANDKARVGDARADAAARARVSRRRGDRRACRGMGRAGGRPGHGGGAGQVGRGMSGPLPHIWRTQPTILNGGRACARPRASSGDIVLVCHHLPPFRRPRAGLV